MDDRFAMRRLGRKSGFQWLAVLVSVGLLGCATEMPRKADVTSHHFGSLPETNNHRLSPDGKRLVYVRMDERDLPFVEVLTIDKKQRRLILASEKNGFDVNHCEWANNERLICSFSAIHRERSILYPLTRLVAINADGSDEKVLLQQKQLWADVMTK
ncbi:hypothetical protein MK280_19650, partial [Myxococcota bacterium]|nr:hypothetical protein [Myxococcota bacterium]